MSSTYRPTFVRIDLERIAENFKFLKSSVSSKAFLCPMVKANAYGHGDAAVSKKLRSLGALYLGVGLVEEGLHLRESGDRGSLLHFGLFDSTSIEVMLENKLTPVVSSIEQLEVFFEAVRKITAGPGVGRSAAGTPVGFHLKINTGMNRLGVSVRELDGWLAKFNAGDRRSLLKLEGVCTHFSDGEDLGLDVLMDGQTPGRSAEQLRQFEIGLKKIRSLGFSGFHIHVANSSAALARISRPLKNEMTIADESGSLGLRPGISIYGSGGPEDLFKPALEFKSRVVLIQNVKTGDRVSYGGRWEARRPSIIGVVPCGYADGFRRGLNNEQALEVIVRGRKVPVLGSICMDYFMCDLTEVQHAANGDEVILIGNSGPEFISAQDLARHLKTIPYEIFTGISERVPRLYVDGEPSVSVISKSE